VCELAEKYGLSVIDLYAVTKEHSELISPDGVHFSKEGYQLLADVLVARVKDIIE
jgi:lysophospholipase L1-like esterase